MICEPYIQPTDLVDCDCPDAPETVTAEMIQVASEIMFALSGRQYPGLCSETIRPCAGGTTMPRSWPYPWYPTKWGSQWLNIGCGCHIDYECGCNGVPQVNLGRGDVRQVFEVVIDGTTLSDTAYRLDDGRYLVRTDGGQWPCCQDLSVDDDAVGAWHISLQYGRQPPQSGKFATAVLATELIKSCVGEDCALPSRVTNITRQGLTMSLLDPQDFLTEGRTGLYEVDLFIKAVNPHGLMQRATAWTPGMKGRSRRVGVVGS